MPCVSANETQGKRPRGAAQNINVHARRLPLMDPTPVAVIAVAYLVTLLVVRCLMGSAPRLCGPLQRTIHPKASLYPPLSLFLSLSVCCRA